MPQTKKQKLYELDPRFFKDYSGDGTGDLRGLSNKMDYFKFLNVDGIILQNTLAAYSEDNVQSFTQVAKQLGTVNDLTTVISKGKSNGTKIFIEIGIGSIRETHRWFENAKSGSQEEFKDVVNFVPSKVEGLGEFKYNKDAKAYYPINSDTQEVPLNWKSERVMEQFVKVVRFWTDLGITGFVFRDFEYLADVNKQEMMAGATLKELRKFFRAIKEIDDNIVIIGKSNIIPISKTNVYTEGPTKVFDYFMSTQISLIGTSIKHGNDQIGKFKTVMLANSIKKYAKNSSNILTFGSKLSGRINSRWGDHGQFSTESAKSLGMLLMLTPASSSVFYGDELGALNIGLTHLDNFQDKKLVTRKKELIVKSKLKEKDIMDAQVLQNPINSRSLMAWDDEKNGGFSSSEKTVTPVSTSYKEINVKNQFADENSVLSFYKELNRMVTKSSYAQIVTKGKFTISSLLPGVIKMISTLKGKEVKTYINLTDKVKRISKTKIGKVILSTHPHKTYAELPTSLEAYEGIVISKYTEEASRATQQIRIKKAKAKAVIQKTEDKEIKRTELEQAKAAEFAKQEAERISAEKQAVAEARRQAAIIRRKERALERTKELKLKKELEAKENIELDNSQKQIDISNDKIALKEAKHEIKQLEKEKNAREEEAIDLENKKEKLLKDNEIEKAKAEETLAKAKEDQLEAERALKEKKARDKEKEIEIANREAAKATALADKIALKEAKQEAKQLEKTRQFNIRQAEKADLAQHKAAAQADREAARILRKEERRLSIMDEEINEDDRTTLTENDIAATTQIDVDEIDDFDAFLNSNKK